MKTTNSTLVVSNILAVAGLGMTAPNPDDDIGDDTDDIGDDIGDDLGDFINMRKS